MAGNDFLKALTKKLDSHSAAESSLANISGYISTGSYAINRILSGSIYNGIPEGRITTFAGPSGSGKSYVVANIIANALDPKQNNYDVVFYVDSEGGGLFEYLKSKGTDLEKIQHIPVASTEECAVKMVNIYTALEEAANAGQPIKALVILDSFGALAAEKVLSDANQKDKITMDMGLNAKLKNTMMSTLMMRVVRSNCALVVINHVYEDPSALFTSKIKEMPGGLKLQFASHIIVQTSKKLIKSNDTEYGLSQNNESAQGYFKGNRILFFTTKNRIIQPGFEAELYLDFNHSFGKWDGLFDEAERLGFIQKEGRKYIVPKYSTDKKFTWDEILKTDEIWNSFLEEFNEKSKAVVAYGSRNDVDQALESVSDED